MTFLLALTVLLLVVVVIAAAITWALVWFEQRSRVDPDLRRIARRPMARRERA